MGSDKYLEAVVTVTKKTVEKGVRRAVENDSLQWLRDSPASSRALVFLIEHEKRDAEQIIRERERYRAVRLLFTLAAMQVESDRLMMEALCCLGTRSVGLPAKGWRKRYKAAGAWLERPIRVERNYERYGHLARVQLRLADDLYDLVTHPDILELALEKNGAIAVAKYL